MRTRRFSWVVAAVVAAAVMSGCSSSKAAPPPPCRPAPSAKLPVPGDVLTERDGGGTYCVVVGVELAVRLHVPANDTGPPWQVAVSSDNSVLAQAGTGEGLVAPRSMATFFSVRKPGVVTIVARRAGVPLFKVTVVARAPSKSVTTG